MIDNEFTARVLERQRLVNELTKAHSDLIQVVRNKGDTLKAYFEAMQAFQALLVFDVKHNS